MQAVAADLDNDGHRLMTEPLAALRLLVWCAGLTRHPLSAARGLGGLWLMFGHARMILCSEQVLDYEAKTQGPLCERSSR